MAPMTGAVDFSECPGRMFGSNRCKCKPACRVCGWRKHMAIHGPLYGQPPGSKPYGHQFEPLIGPDKRSGTEQ